MKERVLGRIGEFMLSDKVRNVVEVIRTGGVSILFPEREKPWTKTMLPTEVSPKDDAAYIRINNIEVARTETVRDGLHIDYDADGDMVGIKLVGFNFQQAMNKVIPQASQGPKLINRASS